MALNDTKLQADIKLAFDTAATMQQPPQQAAKLIELLTAAIVTYVKSAEVAGVSVTVTNNTGTQSGSVKLS